ncbi:hypothetical protein B0I35DRAFT_401502 [Stachybotrys elegans]|uniref:Zn(2)-C6 fungal-type domain-containing protein n=1 Tax=Stachybotrys elegans TaxID=80388 RepID=A0A8K0WKL0_9HYPO|nr:hypothetical protein B0I35DRAFT_401502 [Stachybotrys elegans]
MVGRRAYHTKTKTGCRTCRVRKVRCDEGKPDCVRCTSTGRTCDGYASSLISKSPSPSQDHGPPNATTDLKLILPRQSPQEVRSYRYFIEVTAPSLAGAFHADFWLAEVPRVCMSDAAIWHAVVSLGSAHEDFAQRGCAPGSEFTLRQFNSSIRRLTESRSPRFADRWRALTISTIFTYICTIKGLHDQTRMHRQAGRNLLRELQEDALRLATAASQSRLQDSAPPTTSITSIPISLAPIQSILVNLELQANALDQGGIVDSPVLLAQNKLLNTWRSYEAPHSSARPTPENVKQAHRAAESLLFGLILSSQQHAKQLGDLQIGKAGPDALSHLVVRQEAHTRCFREIAKAIDIFQKDAGHVNRLKEHTILPVRLFHTTNRILLIQDPDEHDLVQRQRGLPALFASVVDLAEQIIDLDPIKTLGVTYTQPLFLVAHSGIGRSIRRRAVALLRRPRLEDGWDSLISARLAEAIMDREMEAAWEYEMEQGLSAGKVGGQEEDVDPMFRIYNLTFSFTGSREGRTVLRTWREKLNNIAGKEKIICW